KTGVTRPPRWPVGLTLLLTETNHVPLPAGMTHHRAAGSARAAYAKRTSVIPAPPVPGRKAWMPHPGCWSSMAGTSTPYPPGGTERRARITSHGSVLGAQQHQGQGRARLPVLLSAIGHEAGTEATASIVTTRVEQDRMWIDLGFCKVG